MKRSLPIFGILALMAATAVAAPPPFPNFSGTTELKTGESSLKGPVHASGPRIRYEAEAEGKKHVTIHDYVKRKSWSITNRECAEIPWPDDGSFPPGTQISWPKEEPLGEETIEGHATKKFRVSGEYDGKPYAGFIWRATDLAGLILRYRDEKGLYESSFHDVKKGAADKKLLEPPNGCPNT